MKTYTLTQVKDKHNEVFEHAQVEPILITTQKRPSHVIVSAQTYQKLIERLEELEDLHFGKIAEIALTRSKMVGSDEFTKALEQIANG